MNPWREKTLLIPAGHPSEAGHFPGNPVVPGALLLDAVVEEVAGAAGGVVIRSVKFLRPVRHGSLLQMRWQAAGEGQFRFECRDAERPVLAGLLDMAQAALARGGS